GVDDNGDIPVVFGRRAHHGGAANVDVFNGGGQIAIGICDRGLEGVEIDHHHIDGFDAVLCHHCISSAATTEDAAVNFGVQGFHPAIHHFGKARVIRDFHGSNAVVAKEPKSATCRQYFNTLLVQ